MCKKNTQVKTFYCWECFIDFLKNFKEDKKNKWIYRGQGVRDDLQTTLERACNEFDLFKKIKNIETHLIKEFRRHYDSEDRDLVNNDTLYCLSLMQHYGAPTRLLDFSYSPYVAAYIALAAKQTPGEITQSTIYCVNLKWLNKDAQNVKRRIILDRRSIRSDIWKCDKSFTKLFMQIGPSKFVAAANAFHLNDRLKIQRGIFLIPGDVTKCFHANLTSLNGWDKRTSMLKLELNFDLKTRKKALRILYTMNVDYSTIFPGLEGFGKSLRPRLEYFSEQEGF